MSKHANRPHRPGRKNLNRPGWVIQTKDGTYRTTTWPTRKGTDGLPHDIPGMRRVPK